MIKNKEELFGKMVKVNSLKEISKVLDFATNLGFELLITIQRNTKYIMFNQGLLGCAKRPVLGPHEEISVNDLFKDEEHDFTWAYNQAISGNEVAWRDADNILLRTKWIEELEVLHWVTDNQPVNINRNTVRGWELFKEPVKTFQEKIIRIQTTKLEFPDDDRRKCEMITNSELFCQRTKANKYHYGRDIIELEDFKEILKNIKKDIWNVNQGLVLKIGRRELIEIFEKNTCEGFLK